MTGQPTQERLTQILAAPVISEKSTYVADKFNQVIFEVIPNATKPEIKAAVELMFKVEVTGVRVSNTMVRLSASAVTLVSVAIQSAPMFRLSPAKKSTLPVNRG